MDKNKKIKFFLKKNFYKLRVLVIILGTILYFLAFYFSDKKMSFTTLIENKTDPMLYICLIFSLLSSLFTNYFIGGFNKKNVKKMTSMEEFEE